MYIIRNNQNYEIFLGEDVCSHCQKELDGKEHHEHPVESNEQIQQFLSHYGDPKLLRRIEIEQTRHITIIQNRTNNQRQRKYRQNKKLKKHNQPNPRLFRQKRRKKGEAVEVEVEQKTNNRDSKGRFMNKQRTIEVEQP